MLVTPFFDLFASYITSQWVESGTDMFTLYDALTASDITVASRSGQGLDAAAIVRRVGSQVIDLSPGDRVMALGSGCFSTSATMVRECCARIPDELSLKDASAMPLAFSTIIHALIDVDQLEKTQVRFYHCFSPPT